MSKVVAPVSEFQSVVNRFPEDAVLVAELAATGETFGALCEEHALATQAVQRAVKSASAYDQAFYEYLEIIRDLEHEIATAIANEKRSLRRSAPTAGASQKRNASVP
ncbi:MAG: hypothetical protein JNM30_00785 [Rhodospirillales bacterium]|nr:hypothetical protein [Rhodospirillales bacterium]